MIGSRRSRTVGTAAGMKKIIYGIGKLFRVPTGVLNC